MEVAQQHIVLSSFNDARLRALVDRPLPGQLRNRSGCGDYRAAVAVLGEGRLRTYSRVWGARLAPASCWTRVNAFRDKVLPSL